MTLPVDPVAGTVGTQLFEVEDARVQAGLFVEFAQRRLL
jgi:hypothetical protein